MPTDDLRWKCVPPDVAGLDKDRRHYWWVKAYGKNGSAEVCMVAWNGKEWISDALPTWDGRMQTLGRLANMSIWWAGPLVAPEGP